MPWWWTLPVQKLDGSIYNKSTTSFVVVFFRAYFKDFCPKHGFLVCPKKSVLFKSTSWFSFNSVKHNFSHRLLLLAGWKWNIHGHGLRIFVDASLPWFLFLMNPVQALEERIYARTYNVIIGHKELLSCSVYRESDSLDLMNHVGCSKMRV